MSAGIRAASSSGTLKGGKDGLKVNSNSLNTQHTQGALFVLLLLLFSGPVLFLQLSWIVFSTVSVPFFWDSNVFNQLLCGLIFGL